MKKLYALVLVALFAPPLLAISLNSRGQAGQGVGGGIAALDDAPLAQPAGGTSFVDDNTLIYQVCDPSCRLEEYDLLSGTKTTVSNQGANTLQAGGGIWAAWLGGVGVYTSAGATFPLSSIGPVGPDGAIALKVLYQSYGPWDVLEKNGARWRLTEGDASGIQLLGQGRALWREGDALKVRGIPQPVTLPGTLWWSRAVFFDGQPWIMYQSQIAGGRLVIHPFNDLRGYVITQGGNSYGPDAVQLGRSIRVAYALIANEAPGTLRKLDIDPTSPRTDLTTLLPVVAPPAPPIVVPPPPGRLASLVPAAVTVDTFALSPMNKIADGDVLVIHDPNNSIGTRVRVYVQGGSMFITIDYPGAGANLLGSTGAKRMVR